MNDTKRQTHPSPTNGVFESLDNIFAYHTGTGEAFSPTLQYSFSESQLLQREAECETKSQTLLVYTVFLDICAIILI